MADLGSTSNLASAPVADKAAPQEGGESTRKNFNYALVKVCDMVDELRIEAVDMCVTAVEKHPGNYEAAAKNIKEQMDKRCGASWHVVVGEGFGFEATHEVKNLLYMYFGVLGILVWKAS